MGVYDQPFWSKNFYDHQARWLHYFNQIRAVAREIEERENHNENFSVLEIGPSYGPVTFYLRKFGVNVKTLDFKPEYQPDFLSSVLKMPLPDNSFDLILVCEVLEHLPFEDFPKALKEIHRVTKKTVFLSLPDGRRMLLNFRLKLPFLKEWKFLWKISDFKRRFSKGHYFEIGKPDYSLEKIKSIIETTGFKIKADWVKNDTPKNHYFILEKI